ncbi:response regulator transcription factor [Neiella marina]|uniref:Response regulator transcription factor n=1 Tax=Neiella holothuriorum TaxID=2870530 RepID=A0ABS7EDU0_9GAMM|nr:response regulator transcription factor [Neiella holothuriorum]MBW8190504.1 response regulator transcription factor [Neiella holothuriorum]
MTPNILIVDDKLTVQQLLIDFLSAQGFATLTASNGLEAIEKVKSGKPDLILLDLMMPVMDGSEFIRKFRENYGTPVIVISAKRQESDIVAGFDLGADDYITKPFGMMELLARIKAVLKRANVDFFPDSKIAAGPLTADLVNNAVSCQGQLVDLTKAEFALLAVLLKAKNRSVDKAKISSQLIEQGFSGSESTLKIHIRNVRQKLAPLLDGQAEIESVFGVGYRLKVTF